MLNTSAILMSSLSSLINAIFIIVRPWMFFCEFEQDENNQQKENKSKLNVLLMCACTLLKQKNITILHSLIKH